MGRKKDPYWRGCVVVGFEVSRVQCLSAGWEVGKDVKLSATVPALCLSAVMIIE